MNFAQTRAMISGLCVAILAAVLVGYSDVPSDGAEGSGGVYVPITAFRLADSVAGTGGYSTPIGAGVTRSFTVLGQGGIPSSGVGAVVVDVAATSATATSTYRLWAGGQSMPSTSSVLSISQADPIVSNTAIVPVGSNGTISLWNNQGSSNYNIDIQGYFTATSSGSDVGGFVPFDEPEHVVDSAAGIGITDATLTYNQDYVVDISSHGIPSGATAVFANVKVYANGNGDGGIRIGAGDANLSSGYPSAVNYGDQWTNTGLSIKLSSDRKIKLRSASSGTTPKVYIDVQGYFSGTSDEGGSYTPITPATVFDAAVPAGGEVLFQVDGEAGLPNDETVGAVAVLVRATSWTSNGGVSIYDADRWAPNETNIRFNTSMDAAAGTATSAIVRTSGEGQVGVTNTGTASVNVRVTVLGWFYDAPEEQPPGATPGSDDPDDVVPETDNSPDSERSSDPIQDVTPVARVNSPAGCRLTANNPHISTRYPTVGDTKGNAKLQCVTPAQELRLKVWITRKRWWGWQKKGVQRGSGVAFVASYTSASGWWDDCDDSHRHWRTNAESKDLVGETWYSASQQNYNYVDPCPD